MLLVLSMGCTLVACGDDDDNNQQLTNQGDREVAELKALVLDENSQITFDATETSGLYWIGVESLEDATNLAGLYAGKAFNGQSYTRTLADNKGTVKVDIGDNGVYYQVRFAVNGIPSFTLDIAEGSGGAIPLVSIILVLSAALSG